MRRELTGNVGRQGLEPPHVRGMLRWHLYSGSSVAASAASRKKPQRLLVPNAAVIENPFTPDVFTRKLREIIDASGRGCHTSRIDSGPHSGLLGETCMPTDCDAEHARLVGQRRWSCRFPLPLRKT